MIEILEKVFKLHVIILLCVVAWNDYKERKIKNKSIACFVLLCVWDMYIYPEVSVMHRIQGAFLISVPLLLIACVIRGSIGGGDIKLVAAGGFLLGTAAIWDAFVTGIMSAGIYVMFLLFTQKAGRKSEIAMGPFLALGIGWEIITK